MKEVTNAEAPVEAAGKQVTCFFFNSNNSLLNKILYLNGFVWMKNNNRAFTRKANFIIPTTLAK